MNVKVFLAQACLFATPWTAAHQAPLSLGLSRQAYWSGLPFPSPGDLPDPGIKPWSPALPANSSPSEPPGKPFYRVVYTWQSQSPSASHPPFPLLAVHAYIYSGSAFLLIYAFNKKNWMAQLNWNAQLLASFSASYHFESELSSTLLWTFSISKHLLFQRGKNMCTPKLTSMVACPLFYSLVENLFTEEEKKKRAKF